MSLYICTGRHFATTNEELARFEQLWCGFYAAEMLDHLRLPFSSFTILTMPAKKTILSDAERAKRIREAAKKIGASDDPKVLDRALRKIATAKSHPRPQ